MTTMYIMCFCQNGFVSRACIGRIAVTLDTIVHHSGCRTSGADDGWLVGWSGWLVLILIFTVGFVRGVLNVDVCALPLLTR